MKDGRLYQANSLDEVYPNKRKAPYFEWHQMKPKEIPGIELKK